MILPVMLMEGEPEEKEKFRGSFFMIIRVKERKRMMFGVSQLLLCMTRKKQR
jgi:hypothetical protein